MQRIFAASKKTRREGDHAHSHYGNRLRHLRMSMATE